MYATIAFGRPVRYGNTNVVRSEADLAYLIKESEVVTNQHGREFFTVLSDGVVRYRVSITSMGFEVSEIVQDSTGECFFLTSDSLPESSLGHAISEGRLFCRAVL